MRKEVIFDSTSELTEDDLVALFKDEYEGSSEYEKAKQQEQKHKENMCVERKE